MRDFFRLTLGTLRTTAREVTVGRLTVQYAPPFHLVLWWAATPSTTAQGGTSNGR